MEVISWNPCSSTKGKITKLPEHEEFLNISLDKYKCNKREKQTFAKLGSFAISRDTELFMVMLHNNYFSVLPNKLVSIIITDTNLSHKTEQILLIAPVFNCSVNQFVSFIEI